MRLTRRSGLVAAPALLVAAWAIVPLASGARTLVLRDVLNTHLALRAGPADAIRAGELPLVDALRGAGQPALGNPNAVLAYPDDLLLLVGSTLWQLNAHFWIHWLVAGFAMAWLGRRWGLDGEAAAVAGVVYASSGYVLSQLNLYNSIVAAALAPALAAAVLGAGERPGSGRRAAAAGAMWALLLLGGDPTLAALAAMLAVTLGVARFGRRALPGRLALALVAGTMVAAPQIVETARIWSESYRGVFGGGGGGGVRSPITILDLLFPLFFGRPDSSRPWANALFGGFPALYFSLAPGTIAIVLSVGAGRPRRLAAKALALVATVGALVVFAGNSSIGRQTASAIGGWFRYTDKLAIWPAVALALAVGLGARAVGREPAAERRMVWTGFALAAVAGSLALVIGLDLPVLHTLLAHFVSGDGSAAVALMERHRWVRIAATVAGVAAASGLAMSYRELSRTARLAILVGLQAASQIFLLAPLLLTDEANRYREPSPLLADVAADSVVVQGGFGGLFGHPDPLPEAKEPAGSGYVELQRRAHLELWGGTARLSKVRTDLDPSPERLSHFTLPAAAQWMRGATDRERVALLAALGVDTLLVPAQLAKDSGAVLERTVALPAPGREQWLYRVPRGMGEASFYGEVVWATDTLSALRRLTAPGFDPARTAVVAGDGAIQGGPSGSVEWIERGREVARLRVDSTAGGVLALRRCYLPIWRVEVDGRPRRTRIAQFSRLAVFVPAGPHEVRFWVDRTPHRLSLLAGALGLMALLALARRRDAGTAGSTV